VIGLALSGFLVRETLQHVAHETGEHPGTRGNPPPRQPRFSGARRSPTATCPASASRTCEQLE
jgi:hypothetical protein